MSKEQEYECIIPSTMSRSCLFPHSSCSDKCKFYQPKKPVEPTCPECGHPVSEHGSNRIGDAEFGGCQLCNYSETPVDLQPDKNTCIHTPPCDFDAGGRPSPCKGK